MTEMERQPTPQELQARWNERVRRYQAGDTSAFSPGVVALGEVRVMGGAGDLPAHYPQIASLDVLEGLAPDERHAIGTVVAAAQTAVRQRRLVTAFAPGNAAGELLRAPELQREGEALATRSSLIIVNAFQGG